MLAACLVPIGLQALAMIVDEGVFHRRREMPRWERIGHPLDTLTIVACLGWLLAGGGLTGYIVLAIASTLFVTKDEGVHAKLCGAGEQWLHAVLFALHPIVLAAFGYLAHLGERGILTGQLAVTIAFMTYQIVYWNLPRRTRTINNDWYADLGERWYHAEDTPIALLRAESRQRNPWIADEIVRALGPASQRVLDLGCGGGFLANFLAARGHVVTGIDTTAENLAVARAHGTATYDVADACALPYAAASFDVVCAMDLIEHVPEPDRLIAEVARVLRPGGVFFFHTFNRTKIAHLIVIKGVEWFVKNTPNDLHVIDLFRSPAEVSTMCQAHGLEIATLHGSRPRFRWPLFRMLLTGRVGNDFAFTFTKSTAIGYTGFARRLDLSATDAPHERVVPEVHERHDHGDRP
ncbi:MAG TPA: bifunctional 2-polyprenyl-6-hydroxyphenol methylase/3-demethylubiquinol 3-O-methyltransferase UbiG [Kofleriaceae bacterium]|nr:bifunctional 2-polyprenyl-6-hydroxyphenol methylase/3-demethylubiquinol 3-O-methyltransferase UbiG [Kofleriaceae bacterium]